MFSFHAKSCIQTPEPKSPSRQTHPSTSLSLSMISPCNTFHNFLAVLLSPDNHLSGHRLLLKIPQAHPPPPPPTPTSPTAFETLDLLFQHTGKLGSDIPMSILFVSVFMSQFFKPIIPGPLDKASAKRREISRGHVHIPLQCHRAHLQYLIIWEGYTEELGSLHASECYFTWHPDCSIPRSCPRKESQSAPTVSIFSVIVKSTFATPGALITGSLI